MTCSRSFWISVLWFLVSYRAKCHRYICMYVSVYMDLYGSQWDWCITWFAAAGWQSSAAPARAVGWYDNLEAYSYRENRERYSQTCSIRDKHVMETMKQGDETDLQWSMKLCAEPSDETSHTVKRDDGWNDAPPKKWVFFSASHTVTLSQWPV